MSVFVSQGEERLDKVRSVPAEYLWLHRGVRGERESAEKLQKQMGRLANQQRAKANWELLSAELDVNLRSLPWGCRLSDGGTEAGAFLDWL
jgi:hypothetical protein